MNVFLILALLIIAAIPLAFGVARLLGKADQRRWARAREDAVIDLSSQLGPPPAYGVALGDMNARYPSGRARHKRRGMNVNLLRVALEESTLSPVVVYEHAGVVWTRPVAEFRDRFESIP